MTLRVLRLLAFLGIAFGISVGLGLKILGTSFESRYGVSAAFDDVTRLQEGDPVKMAGVRVGRVEHIELRDGRAHIRFSVSSDIKLPRDSVVAVKWRNLIAQRELYLDPGPNPSTATDFLPTDGSAVIEHTRSATDVSVLVNAVGVLGESIDPNQLNTIFTSMAQALQGNGPALDSLVKQLVGLLDVVGPRANAMGQLASDLNSMTTVLAQRDQQIQFMVDNLALLSQAFTDNTGLFLSAVDNLASVAPGVDDLLTQNETAFRGILDNVAVVVGVLADHATELEQALAGLPTGLEAVFEVVREGPYVKLDIACAQFAQFPCNAFGGDWLPVFPSRAYPQAGG